MKRYALILCDVILFGSLIFMLTYSCYLVFRGLD
jgi:hypothetical protein